MLFLFRSSDILSRMTKTIGALCSVVLVFCLSPLAQSQSARLLPDCEYRLTPRGEVCGYDVPIRVQGVIQEVNRTFVVDTGASINLIDRSLKEQLSPPIGSVMAGTAGQDIEITIHEAPSFMLANGKVDLGVVALVDLDGISRVLGFKVAGILGVPLVREFGIGYERALAAFHVGRRAHRRFNFTFPLEVNDKNQLYTKDIYVDGNPIRCLIDSGMNGPLSITPDNFESLVARNLISELYHSQVRTLSGTQSRRFGILSSMEAWGVEFLDIPVISSSDNKIGLELLKRFDFYLNCASGVIEVNYPDGAEEPFLYDISGVSTESIDGELVIASVRPDSPAQRVNLMAGMRIVAVNDRDIDTDWRELYLLRKHCSTPGPKSLKLQIEENTVRREVHLEW